MAQHRVAHARDRNIRRAIPLRPVDRHTAHGHGTRCATSCRRHNPGHLQQLGDDSGEGTATHRGERHRYHHVPRLPPAHQHVRVGVVGMAATSEIVVPIAIEI